MNSTELLAGDLPALTAALHAAGLPTADLGRRGQKFWRFSEGDGVLGYAGLEIRGGDALLRSVVVMDAVRGQGHGLRFVDAMARHAARNDLGRLWLLTLDAAEFFRRAGFTRVERSDVPAGIAALEEFTSLCPVSAVCMKRDLTA
jgi:amino-acid N-acetyltransferase